MFERFSIFVAALLLLGLAGLESGNTTDDISAGNNSSANSVTVNKPDIDTWIHEARAQFSAGNINESIKAYNQALKLAPHNSSALREKGSALSKLGKYLEALQLLNESILIDPENAKGWKEKAFALNELGRYSESLKNANMSLLIDSQYADAWQIKGLALECLGLYSESNAAYYKASKWSGPYSQTRASESPLSKIASSEADIAGARRMF